MALELARHHAVAGLDSSAAMIRLARENVPGARFVHGDIMAVDLPRTYFHAVVAFYSIFHLPREEHPALFARIHGWLRPGGYFLGTLSHAAEAPYLEDDFFGETMYWSNFGLADYVAQLQETGFICLMTGGVGHGYQAGHETPGESHPLVLAQKQA